MQGRIWGEVTLCPSSLWRRMYSPIRGLTCHEVSPTIAEILSEAVPDEGGQSGRRSEALRGHSEAFRGTQWHSVALGGTWWHSEALRGTQKHSEALSGHQRALKGHSATLSSGTRRVDDVTALSIYNGTQQCNGNVTALSNVTAM